MPLLTSKIQYNTFEIGEFVKERERTFEEVVELIEEFPWELQRDNIRIELTNPSITLHGKNGDYLKLALYYKGKFVLRYFDHEGKLYSKGFYDLKESYLYIKKLFELDVFDYSDFKKENTWLEKNLVHFVSQDFRYEVTADSAMRYLFSTSWISFLFSLFLFGFVELNKTIEMDLKRYLIVIIPCFIIGGGTNLILFFQYYFYSKDKILIMSKGNDEFYFGNKEQPIKYNKSQIIKCTLLSPERGMLMEFALVMLVMDNRAVLKIPNILVDKYLMVAKINHIKIENKNIYPFLKLF